MSEINLIFLCCEWTETEIGHYLQKAEELWRKRLGDGRKFALSDLMPSVSIGGERLRPRSADHSQSQSKDVCLRQATVVLKRKQAFISL